MNYLLKSYKLTLSMMPGTLLKLRINKGLITFMCLQHRKSLTIFNGGNVNAAAMFNSDNVNAVAT